MPLILPTDPQKRPKANKDVDLRPRSTQVGPALSTCWVSEYPWEDRTRLPENLQLNGLGTTIPICRPLGQICRLRHSLLEQAHRHSNRTERRNIDRRCSGGCTMCRWTGARPRHPPFHLRRNHPEPVDPSRDRIRPRRTTRRMNSADTKLHSTGGRR